MPAVRRRAARKSVLRHLVDTFFDGSAEQVVAAVLGGEGSKLSEEELDRIAELVAKARHRSAAVRHWVLAAAVPPARRQSTPQLDAARRRSPAAGSAWPFDFAGALQSIWIAGAVISLCILLVGMLRLTWLAAHARRVTRGRWNELAEEAELLRAVYWFNPLLWIACRRLRLESEHACDDEVMNRGVEGSDYANHLVELARALNQRRHTWFPAPAMARPSSLERRVRAMLNDHLNRTPITGTTRAAIFAVLLVMTVAVATAQSGFVSFSGSVVDEQGRAAFPVPR